MQIATTETSNKHVGRGDTTQYYESLIMITITFCFIYRRVHITKATMEQLGGQFELEPGNGGAREGYLADHKVETYLIVPPKVINLIC